MKTASPPACPQRSISSASPAAAIIRQALEDYLTRQPAPRISAVEAATTLAAMAASIAELQEQMQEMRARLDMLAADRQPEHDSQRQPTAPPMRTPPTPACRPSSPRGCLWRRSLPS